MVAKCANPRCETPFHYFRGGKLFLVDTPQPSGTFKPPKPDQDAERHYEYFWLCERCCVARAFDLAGQLKMKSREILLFPTP